MTMIRFREGRCFDLEEVKSENWGTGESLGTNGRKLSKSLEKHRKIIGVSAKNRKIIHDQTISNTSQNRWCKNTCFQLSIHLLVARSHNTQNWECYHDWSIIKFPIKVIKVPCYPINHLQLAPRHSTAAQELHCRDCCRSRRSYSFDGAGRLGWRKFRGELRNIWRRNWLEIEIKRHFFPSQMATIYLWCGPALMFFAIFSQQIRCFR